MGRWDRDALSQNQQVEVRPPHPGFLRRLGKMTYVRIKAILREDCIRAAAVAIVKTVEDSGKSRCQVKAERVRERRKGERSGVSPPRDLIEC